MLALKRKMITYTLKEARRNILKADYERKKSHLQFEENMKSLRRCDMNFISIRKKYTCFLVVFYLVSIFARND